MRMQQVFEFAGVRDRATRRKEVRRLSQKQTFVETKQGAILR